MSLHKLLSFRYVCVLWDLLPWLELIGVVTIIASFRLPARFFCSLFQDKLTSLCLIWDTTHLNLCLYKFESNRPPCLPLRALSRWPYLPLPLLSARPEVTPEATHCLPVILFSGAACIVTRLALSELRSTVRSIFRLGNSAMLLTKRCVMATSV
jgi:hypothetical protein